MKKIVTLTSLISMIAIISGCATTPEPTLKFPTFVDIAVIATEGVEIRAEDGSFHWKAGEVIKFTESSFEVKRSATGEHEILETPGVPPISVGRWTTDNLPKASENCTNCTNVRVKVPGRKVELYGQMHFEIMSGYAIGPGAQSYRIEVPQKYVDQAVDGQRSVIYELVESTLGYSDTSWVLWLSDMPL